MNIDLHKLNYAFIKKPLLIGGKAKEYYGIRTAGKDIDFVVSQQDYKLLAEKYPNSIKDLQKDLGIVIDGFELWKTICWYDYEYLSDRAKDEGTYLVISLERLLFLTALGMHKEKYFEDLKLIVNKIISLQKPPYNS